jgi:hypothetical protein
MPRIISRCRAFSGQRLSLVAVSRSSWSSLSEYFDVSRARGLRGKLKARGGSRCRGTSSTTSNAENGPTISGVPNGIRTRVTALKARCPGPARRWGRISWGLAGGHIVTSVLFFLPTEGWEKSAYSCTFAARFQAAITRWIFHRPMKLPNAHSRGNRVALPGRKS